MRHIVSAFVSVMIFGGIWFADNYPNKFSYIKQVVEKAGYQLAAVITHNPKTVVGLKSSYNNTVSPQKKIRILIVPGHQSDSGGTDFRGVYERDIVVTLSDYLREFLGQSNKYEVFYTRTNDAWTPIFSDYFKNNWDDIVVWRKAYKQEAKRLISIGTLSKVEPKVHHNRSPDNAALRLHGVNKWANENNIDIVIHVHFNDYPRHDKNIQGKYSGFAIYVPEKQYQNSTAARAVAQAVFARLAKNFPISDFSGESGGIVEDQDLIAIGVDDSLDAASILIEYAYIYEPKINNKTTRENVLKDMALQTYLGIQDFFDLPLSEAFP